MEGNHVFSWLYNPDSPKDDETESLSGLKYMHEFPSHEDICIHWQFFMVDSCQQIPIKESIPF